MSAPIDLLLPQLRGVRKNGTGWLALCPGHDDRTPSLSVHVGDDGRVLVRCFAGCELERVVGALGLTPADLFPPREGAIRANGHGRQHRLGASHRQPPPASQRKDDSKERIPKCAVDVRRWSILDASGRVAGVHVRTDFDDSSKALKWERADGRSGLGGLGSKEMPLYGIHEQRPGQITI